jgi:hypothetical protein
MDYSRQVHNPPAPSDAAGPTPSLVAGVLARLPDADRERALERRHQLRQRLGAVVVAALLLLGCLGPETSNPATHWLTWVLAGADAWQALVRVLLGGAIVLPILSTLCLVGLSLVLWEQCLQQRHRRVR